MRSVNPATEEVIGEFETDSPVKVEAKLARACTAFELHRRESIASRADKLNRAAMILEQEAARLGAVATAEMGKTLKSAREEVLKCAFGCRYYAANGEQLLAPQAHENGEVLYQPLGPVLAVMPWNFPFWQVFRFAAPALMAGNVGLLKHASNVPQCAMAIEDVLLRAGFEKGVFQTLLIGSSEVPGLIADARVKAVTLTGSVAAGREVASQAGRHIKKTVLELGGSDPFIVMPSADLGEAVEVGVQARIVNNGQSCIAAKRFLIHETIYDRFTELYVERMRTLKVGDPMKEDTELGPLATGDGAASLSDQVKQTVAMGARVLTGGERRNGWGFYFEPTVLDSIPPDSPPIRDELFGPVASLFRVRNAEDAIARANETAFGLGSSVWTNDPGEQHRFTEEIEAGMVFFNAMVASDPRVPFGGVKDSGYGRELSAAGIREFTNMKTIWRGKSQTTRTE